MTFTMSCVMKFLCDQFGPVSWSIARLQKGDLRLSCIPGMPWHAMGANIEIPDMLFWCVFFSVIFNLRLREDVMDADRDHSDAVDVGALVRAPWCPCRLHGRVHLTSFFSPVFALVCLKKRCSHLKFRNCQGRWWGSALRGQRGDFGCPDCLKKEQLLQQRFLGHDMVTTWSRHGHDMVTTWSTWHYGWSLAWWHWGGQSIFFACPER